MTETTVEDIKSEIKEKERRLKFQFTTCDCGHKFEDHEAWSEHEDECIEGCNCRQFNKIGVKNN